MRITALASTFQSLLLVLLVLGVTGAKAEEGYVGTWGTGPAQCALGQDEEDAPLVMTATGYDQHKIHCRFKSVTVKAGGAEPKKSL